MKLYVEPKNALVDEKLTIYLTELESYETVRISAAMNLPWAESETYASYALFTSDSSGRIDLSKQKPDSGTYDWEDSMGLISSLQKVNSEGADLAADLSIDHNLLIDISVEHQNGRETVTVERMFQKPGVKRLKIKDPFIGELFHTGNSGNKTVILLGGSGSGDITPLALIAGPLASHGFNVLTVGYYGGKDQPEHLQNVPLEYFETVICWIQENPSLNSDGIYVHGTSKGGELALLLASRYHEFSKVVANMPHAYCFQGLEGIMGAAGVSSWSYKGKPLPYIELDNNIFYDEMKKCVEQNKPFGIACCYVKGLEPADNKQEARINIENAAADLLLIADEKDMIWNSADGCREIMSTLDNHQYRYKYELLSYEEMGHTSLPVPFVVPISESLHMKMNGGVFSVGGTLKGNAHGQYDSWIKTLEFLRN